jgi:hypothetical protein
MTGYMWFLLGLFVGAASFGAGILIVTVRLPPPSIAAKTKKKPAGLCGIPACDIKTKHSHVRDLAAKLNQK